MSWDDFIEDYLWLVENGVHPVLACEQIGIRPQAAERKLWRAGENRLARELHAGIVGKDVAA